MRAIGTRQLARGRFAHTMTRRFDRDDFEEGTIAMGSNSSSRRPGELARTPLYLAILACVLGSPLARAQTTEARPAKVAPPDTSPLARFIPKENLALYIEFAGLDAHEAAWKNSASYKMLNETTLGEVLEAVSEQLLEKAVSFFPDHRLSGKEIVTLVKHSARAGWVVALNADSKARLGYRGTFVLRGGASKDNRGLSSRLMGWFMAASKPRVEEKAGRQLVIVPEAGAQANATNTGGWAWWAEQNDLVVGFLDPKSAEATIAVLDGKAPSAVDHALIKDLAKPEGKFEPVCFGFVDPAVATGSSSQLATRLQGIKANWGADRVDLQWGFEGEALLSMMKLVGAKPRKGLLAAFDGPSFNKTSLLPPDQVNSFVETSINPKQFLDLIKQMAPSDEVKEQVDEIAKSVKSHVTIDFERDVLGHIGPRMVAYVAPGKSAVTNDDSLDGAFKDGFSLAGLMSAMQSSFPKLTIVAEVKNPEAFSKALDGLFVAINTKLKEMAKEKAQEERDEAEAEKKDDARPGRGGAGGRLGAAGGGDRGKTRRVSPSQTTAPRFELASSSGKGKLFILSTPRSSPLHFGPASFRPTVEFDGVHVAFAMSPDAAKNALTVARRKDWRPSGDLVKAFEAVENNLVLLAVSDVSATLPGVLASLPGTLQTMINTTWALANGKAGTDAAGGNRPTTPGPAGFGGGGLPPGAGQGRRGGLAMPGGGMAPQGAGPVRGRPGGGQGAPNQATAAGSNNGGGSTGEPAIVFNVEAEKLPKASDLKSHLFPSTIAISVTDQDIRIVSREAFPDLGSLINALPILGMTPFGKALIDKAKVPAATPTPDASATGGAQGGAAGAGAPPTAAPPTTKATPPGGVGGRGAGARRRDQ